MRVTLFIVTYAKDFPYLKYCLKSIAKFAKGFDQVAILVPKKDMAELWGVSSIFDSPMGITRLCGDEWPDKGMLWHMAQIVRSDEWCPDADIILHMDADCVFIEPVTPQDYIIGQKPLLLYESFQSLGINRGFGEVLKWQTYTQACLPFEVKHETMRRHPEVYHRNLYAKARELIEQKVKEPVDDYISKQRNEFPQTFCEFNTLGNVALKCFANEYELYDLEHKSWPKSKLHQGWGHGGMRDEDMAVFKKIGIA